MDLFPTAVVEITMSHVDATQGCNIRVRVRDLLKIFPSKMLPGQVLVSFSYLGKKAS